MRGPAWALAVLLQVAGCGDEPEPASSPSSSDLGGDVVARVGGASIGAATVRRIAEAQAVTLEVARERAVHDALFAEEASARGLDAASLEATVLARLLAEALRGDVAGPITDEELERVTARHWLDLRRPEGYRVVHAVVLGRHGDRRALDDAEARRASELGAAIRAAVGAAADRARAEPPAPDGDAAVAAFRELVQGIDAGGLEVKVEALDPFAADGRVLHPRGGTLVPEFVDVVSALRERGAVAGPFRTPFGVHVAMLLERTPPHEVPADERRALLADEVLDDRIRARRDALLEAESRRVELAPNAAALLDLVRVQ